MPSDYEQIKRDNIRKYGTEEAHLALLVRDLYSDRTHFIFELLQNAEDAGASKVKFSVFYDRLELTHDGRRFTAQDVKGVCGIAEGQKADDLTKIGRFGIGFKSVYAYTTSPEIHSGDEHFRVNTYVRPHHARHRKVDHPWTTLFVFPFNKDEPDQQTAFREITVCLSNLNTRTLLFLRKIKELEYASDETSGTYLREESRYGTARKIELIGDNDDETWVVFERPASKPGSKHKVYVELGFRMNTKTETIESEHNTPLVVYFPTEKSTRLGFYIQGPYRTTLARDNVPKDNSWNRKLIEETAELTVTSLHELKTMNLLTISLLEALPIRAADFPSESMFSVIFTRVKYALKNEDLLPADDGSFVAARHARLVRGVELMKLLDQDQLRRLSGANSVRWLSSDITQNRTPDLRKYLIDELGVNEFSPEDFAGQVTDDFLRGQSDDWISKFYCFLSEHRALWRPAAFHGPYNHVSEGVLRNKAILRVQDGSHVPPFHAGGGPNAYLIPSTSASEQTTEAEVPIVKAELMRHDDARKFLEALGVPRFDIVEEVMRHVLPKYENNKVGGIPAQENHDDLAKIAYAYRTASDAKLHRLHKRLIRAAFILCTVPETGKQEYRAADRVYFRSDELCRYFEGNKAFAYVERSHVQCTLFAKVGVKASVRVKRTQHTQGSHVVYTASHGNHVRGRDGFDRYLEVDGLEWALDRPTADKSAFIWNEIAIPYYRSIRGNVESSSRQNYLRSKTKEVTSSFGALFIGKEWLPNADKMCRPSDLSIEDLPESFERGSTEADQLALKLGMKTDVDGDVLARVGVSLAGLDLIRRIESAPQEIRQQIERILPDGRERPDFPTGGAVVDQERRKNRVRSEYNASPRKGTERKARSVRTSRGSIDPDTQLREWYTNKSDQMVCQICLKEMPFKKRDNQYYFESVEVLSADYVPNEHASQYLALCPLCAAKYKYFVKDDPHDKAMKALRLALIDADSRDGVEVPLKLGQSSATLRFVVRHVIDLKAILDLSSTP